jgi:hypothetical protein
MDGFCSTMLQDSRGYIRIMNSRFYSTVKKWHLSQCTPSSELPSYQLGNEPAGFFVKIILITMHESTLKKKDTSQPWGPLSGVKFRDGDFVSGLWIQILLPETYSKLHLNDCAQQQSPVELWGLPEITVSGYEIARSGMHPALFCLKCLVFFAEKPSLRRRKKVLTSLQNKSIREWGA